MPAATLTKPSQTIPAWQMPRPEIGKRVLWYDDLESSNPPAPAIVMRVNEDSVDLNIIVHGSPTFLLRDGVKYVKDPDRAKISRLACGCWDFIEVRGSPGQIARMAELENQVTELKLRVDGLTVKK